MKLDSGLIFVEFILSISERKTRLCVDKCFNFANQKFIEGNRKAKVFQCIKKKKMSVDS